MPRARRWRILATAVAATAGFSSAAFSSVTLDPSSSAKITHDADIGSAADTSQHKNVVPIPDSGSLYPNVADYSYGSKTVSLVVGSNTGTSTAAGSVGAITNSANLGFTLAGGTGITQNDPSGNVFTGSAELKFQVDGIWDVGTGGYGPGYGYVAFTIAATVPKGGSGSVQVDLNWTDANTHTALRSEYTKTLTLPTGTTTQTVSNSLILQSGEAGNTFSKNRKIEVAGTITLLAGDPCNPVKIQPVDFESSAAPPTWKFSPAAGSTTLNFGSAANWTNEMGLASGIPNQPGARAQFEGTSAPIGPVLVTQPITLGMLDIDQPGANFQAVGNNPFIFNTVGPNAVLLAENLHDPSTIGHTINVPIQLQRTTEFENDAAGSLILSNSISGTGGIEKNGLGEVVLSSTTNSLTGPVNINAGALTVTGSLPANGHTTVNAGGVLAGAGNGVTTGRLGNVTLSGGSIHPGPTAADGNIGTLSISSLTIQSGNLRFDIGATTDRINAGSVLINGPTTITPVIPNLATFSTGTYTLVSATTLTTSPGATPILAGVPTTSRLVFTLDTASVPNSLLLDVTGSTPKAIRWSGSSGPLWDLNSTQNWLDSTSNPEHYFDYDSPTFDDNATNPNVTLNAIVTPSAVTFNNSVNYSLTGNGGIAGTMNLTKTGTGQVSLGLNNSYTGTTSVQQGTLQMATPTALSANTTVVLGSGASAGTLDLNGWNVTVGGITTSGTSASNTITNGTDAGATLTFSGGSSTFGGVITNGVAGVSLHVAKGTLILTGNNTSSGTTTIDSVATSNQDVPGTVSDGVATLQIGNGSTTGSLGSGPIIDNGVLVFDRSDNIVVSNDISGSGAIIKTGAGSLSLQGNNSFSGITVQSGVLTFGSDASLGGTIAPVTLDGGTLGIQTSGSSQRPIYLGMTGGTLDTGAASVQFDNVSGCGDFTKLGSGTLVVNSISAESLNLTNGGLIIRPGRSALHKHIYVEEVNIGNGATVDLGDNDLIYDYDNGGVADPAQSTMVKNLLLTGRNGGAWNGTGLTSSVAQAVASNSAIPYKTALAYAEASKTGLATFDGVPTDNDMILIRYTLLGDANLDGTVNALDFNALATGFGSANPQWVNGDFNYTTTVDTTDFAELAINFGQSLYDPPPGPGALVPEPLGVMTSMLALSALAARRRRSRIGRGRFDN
jgi:autotransporter-associated beta strand protein